MKKSFVFTVFLFLIFANFVCYADDDKKQRYKLFNATYNIKSIDGSNVKVIKVYELFKIDSKTGDSWKLLEYIKNGKKITQWVEIPYQKLNQIDN